jgi:DNA-binding response OmpR family regulator
MHTYFPTVPVEVARQKARFNDSERLLPVVLVVDHEPLIAETLCAILNGNGLAAITAPDGNVALDVSRLIPPQLLVSDMDLPGMDGFELAMELTRMIPDCEVILFSGQYSTGDLASMHNSEDRDFLTLAKPVHPVDLLECVFERLSRHGWPAPAAFRRRPPTPIEAFSPRAIAVHRRPKGDAAASRGLRIR